MKKNNRPIKPIEKEIPSLKDDFKNQFKRKKETQQEAKDRRQRIREYQEDRDWN
jgi:hypothetical protein